MASTNQPKPHLKVIRSEQRAELEAKAIKALARADKDEMNRLYQQLSPRGKLTVSLGCL